MHLVINRRGYETRKGMTDVELKPQPDSQNNAHAHVSHVSTGGLVRMDLRICSFEAARGRLKSAAVRNAAAG